MPWSRNSIKPLLQCPDQLIFSIAMGQVSTVTKRDQTQNMWIQWSLFNQCYHCWYHFHRLAGIHVPIDWPGILRLTGRPGILQLTGRPKVLQLEDRPEILQLGGRPGILQLAGRPGILNLIEGPGILQLTDRPEIPQLSLTLSVEKTGWIVEAILHCHISLCISGYFSWVHCCS